MKKTKITLATGDSINFDSEFLSTPEIASLERATKMNKEYITMLKARIAELESK